jgi:hypothetical protein
MDLTTLQSVAKAYQKVSSIKSPADLDKYNKWLSMQKEKSVDVDAVSRHIYPALQHQIQQLRDVVNIDIQKPYTPVETVKKVPKPRGKKAVQPPLTMEE